MGNTSGAFKYILFFVLISTVITTYSKDNEIKITTSSQEALSLFIEGRNYTENFNIIRAAGLFDKALAADPDFALAHLFRSISFVGGFNVSREHLNKAVGLADKVTEGERYLILYWKASSDGNELQQKVFVDKLLSSFPGDKRVQNLAGIYFYQLNDFKTALDHFQKAVALDENFAPSYNMIGYCQSTMENYDAAEQAFQTYIKLLPDNPNPYDSYAELLMKTGRYDESIEEYKTAFSKDNTFFTAVIGQGNNYALKGDYNMARLKYKQVFKEASNINTRLGSLYWEATTYVHEGDIDKAISVLDERKALAETNNLTPTIVNTLNLQGFILTESGDPENGIMKFKEASHILETTDLPNEVKNNLKVQTDLNMCYGLAENNRLVDADRSLQMCKNEIMKRGNPTEIQNLHQTMAMIDMKKGDYSGAISNFEKSNLIDAPYSWYKLSQAYEMTGNKKAASEYKSKAEKANVNGVGLAIVREKSME